MDTHRFILEPYKGIATRHTCPNCNQKRCFSRYIDTEQNIVFPEYVGRCDHEQKCGYHFTPKMYFEQNPTDKERLNEMSADFVRPRIIKSKPTSYLEEPLMHMSMRQYENNNLFKFLSNRFGEEETLELMQRYHVGSSKYWQGSTVFWQTDIQGNIRTGKIMLYNPENGKRIKEPYNHITWVHSVLKRSDFNLRQCLFGEHLLPSYHNRPIALVESEKSVLIASVYLPQYLWIATGGKNGAFNREAMSVLQGREVLLFPDLGATEQWKAKMDMMIDLGINVHLFDFMERNATNEEHSAGYDIADYLLQEKTNHAILCKMTAVNPNLKYLIEEFDLQLIDEDKISENSKIKQTFRRRLR